MGIIFIARRGSRFLFFVFALLIPLSFAQRVHGAEKTVGVIMGGDTEYYGAIHQAITSRLTREGGSGKVQFIIQKPYPDPVSLSNAARKLIALEVDAIVAYGAPAALAVQREKTKIPVVYAGVYEPLASKIDGRNMTGVSCKVSLSSLLRYLKSITSISTLGIVYGASEEDSVYQSRELVKIALQYGMKTEEIGIRAPQEAKAKVAARGVDAIIITKSSVAAMALPSIMEACREKKIPTASLFFEKGSYPIVILSPSPREQGEKAAEKLGKVLSNTPPERIKAESTAETELIFNLKELRDLGLRIPMNLVTEATRLVQ